MYIKYILVQATIATFVRTNLFGVLTLIWCSSACTVWAITTAIAIPTWDGYLYLLNFLTVPRSADAEAQMVSIVCSGQDW